MGLLARPGGFFEGVCEAPDGVEDEVDEVNSIYTNELGIYRLIFQSRMPEAEAFRKWVFRIIKKIREGNHWLPPLNRRQIKRSADFLGE
jgi:hypothetical protein